MIFNNFILSNNTTFKIINDKFYSFLDINNKYLNDRNII